MKIVLLIRVLVTDFISLSYLFPVFHRCIADQKVLGKLKKKNYLDQTIVIKNVLNNTIYYYTYINNIFYYFTI